MLGECRIAIERLLRVICKSSLCNLPKFSRPHNLSIYQFSALALAVAALAAQPTVPAHSCKPIGRPQLLPTVPEASGIAQAGGMLWTHNDSDAPVLYRLDGAGRATPVTVVGADVRDWEDLASAPCRTGTCLYIADIGDNRAARDRITIYEVPVPEPGSTSTKPASAFHARYPDRPHDAEALLATRQTGIFIITKEASPRVYRFAVSRNPGETSTLAFVRTLNEKERITGAAASPDGRWVALRSNGTLLVYTVDDFVNARNPVRVDLRSFKEPQGEGVAFGRGGEIYFVSEGGRDNASGILTRIHCAFIQ